MDSATVSETAGEISTEIGAVKYIVWNVPDSLLLSRDTKHSIHSPTFQFTDETWYLQVTMNDAKTRNYSGAYGSVDLFLVKKFSATSNLRINYEIGIKKIDGEIFSSDQGVATFNRYVHCCGKSSLLSRLDVCHQKVSLAPNGVMTFFCYFRLDSICKTELSKGISFGNTSTEKISSSLENNEISLTGFSFGNKSTEKISETSENNKTSLTGISFGNTSTEKITDTSENNNISLTGFSVGNTSTEKISDTSENNKISLTGFSFGSTSTEKISDTSENKKTSLPGFAFGKRGSGCAFGNISTDKPECSKTSSTGFSFGNIPTEKISDTSKDNKTSSTGFSFGNTSTLNITGSSGGFSFGQPLPVKHFGFYPTMSITGGFNFGKTSTEKTSDTWASNQTFSTETSKLRNDLKNLFINGEDSDVIIKVKGAEFKAHKNILRARSSVFYSMFSHDMVEKNSGTVDVTDYEPEAFKIFLLYLYNGSVENLSTNNVFDLYRVAEKYDAEELKHKCKEFMVSNLSVDTACDVIEHALQYDEESLLKTATEFFTKNFKQVILTVKWQSFLKTNTVAANELLIKASNFYVFKNRMK